MPHQIAQLPRPERLTLCFCGLEEDSLAPLSHLAGSLTRLQHLSAEGYCGPAASAVIGGALRHLTQLTCLVLRCAGSVDPPAALAGLPNLQRCYLHGYYDAAPGAGAAEAPPLPAGPWLASLRWLGASIDTLASSVPLLRQETALQFVKVCEHDVGEAASQERLSWRAEPAAALFDCLVEHPPLQRLSIQPLDTSAAIDGPRPSVFDSYRSAALLARLARCRPNLQLRCSALAGDFSWIP